MSQRDNNERFLGFLSRMIADGNEVNVSVLSRAKDPITVLFGSRRIILHEDVPLLDVCLAARLLSFRSKFQPYAETSTIPAELRQECIHSAFRSLREQYPKIAQLSAQFQLAQETTWPKLAWSDLEVLPLDHHADSAGATHYDGIEVSGAEDDLDWILQRIPSGEISTEDWEPLRPLRLATIPLRFSTPMCAGPEFERYQQELKSPHFRARIHGITKCYTRKCEDSDGESPDRLRQKYGFSLDSAKLVKAAVSRRAGLTTELFKQRNDHRSAGFDPSRHLIILAFDTGIFRPGPLGDPAVSRSWLVSLFEVYRQLGTDFLVLAFNDRIAELPDDRGSVMVHMPAVLKRVNEIVDEAFFTRFSAAIASSADNGVGTPCCFHPLLLRTVVNEAKSLVMKEDYRHVSIIITAHRGMPDTSPYHHSHFLSRTANAMDEIFKTFERGLRADYENLCFVPVSLIGHARPGGATASMHSAALLR